MKDCIYVTSTVENQIESSEIEQNRDTCPIHEDSQFVSLSSELQHLNKDTQPLETTSCMATPSETLEENDDPFLHTSSHRLLCQSIDHIIAHDAKQLYQMRNTWKTLQTETNQLYQWLQERIISRHNKSMNDNCTVGQKVTATTLSGQVRIEKGKTQEQWIFPNGNWKIIHCDGKTETYYANAQIYKLTFAHCQWIFFPNGQLERRWWNGSREIIFRDGSIAILSEKGEICLYSRKGEIVRKQLSN